MPVSIDMLDIVLSSAGLVAAAVIFYMQQGLSKQQVKFARAQGELELREKFGPIQSHVLELRVETRRFRNLATELQGSLVRFSENPELCRQLSGFDETKRRIDSILSEPGGQSLFTTTIKELQNEEPLIHEFRHLDKSIEDFQRGDSANKVFPQSDYDNCQKYIRDLLETVEGIARRSVFLFTDCRAVEAVYGHTDDKPKMELGVLLSEFWDNPLRQLPVPPAYKGGKYNGRPLTDVLEEEEEVPKVCKYVRNSRKFKD
ncbi:MAG: hypothetical protein LC776_18570 [Acidobacteria bacterium]|nr:hypothetical protein [Acidobacteriota bacterium]